MWDLSSLTRDWTHVPWIGRQILNHWTTREVPAICFLKKLVTLPYSVSLGLNFAGCIPWVSCNSFPPPSRFPVGWYLDLEVRARFKSFFLLARSLHSVSVHQGASDVCLSLPVSCHAPPLEPLLGIANRWCSNSVILSSFISQITSVKRNISHLLLGDQAV